jgi:hypothetical protein
MASEKSFIESACIVAAGLTSLIYLYACVERMKHHKPITPELEGVTNKKVEQKESPLSSTPPQSPFQDYIAHFDYPLRTVMAN